jgi:uncharacterized membrane protein YhhN
MPLADIVTGVALLVALAYVAIVAGGVRGRVRGIKPLPALLLAAAYPDWGPVFACWAVGDTLLLDKDRFFLHGLFAFLVGHLWFIAVAGGTTGISWAGLGAGVLTAALLVGLLWPGLRPRLRVPVVLYALSLAGVLATAIPAGKAAGAIVFLISDAVLAWNRFRKPLPRGDLVVMATYYAAIFLFARG